MFGLNRIALAGGGIVLAASLVWGGLGWRSSSKWEGRFNDVTAKMHALTTAIVPVMLEIRLASNNPKLSLADAAEQVRLIDASRKAWKSTAEGQSDTIEAMGRDAANRKAINAERAARLKPLLDRKERAIQRLANEAKTPADRVDCARQLFEAEAALDQVYQEGL